MSNEISRRFEGPPQPRSAAFLMQCERIRKDEETADQAFQIRLDKQVNERALWNEQLEEKCQYKRLRQNMKFIEGELTMAKKASIEIRRVALKQQIDQDKDLYDKELLSQGKTFYKQRI
ncbi:hypothetical protein LOTGIDRAFT_230606 [Lottia gigantea]|uniref:Uncharacterized protein n=1 Tax=Lottia gigantea TaxID=225164 RepID=V4AV68_LOTGI|nr:hypothetical protein LOTGIDRAFT_230606 [Lottia gigantea]ESP01223.1 hypothetical protein LOTGIDRAFT_230606 [Lottia gigantea]